MKFLVDVCAGNRLANWLKDHGHDVLEVRDREPTMADEEILHWANVEKRVIVTMDKDFGTLAVALNQPHNGIVRLPDVPVLDRQRMMDQVILTHSQDLEDRAIITVSRRHIRVRF
jgi:predicted nuclease of predicted toxin-antitoxin system